jgi:hypothetical protein
MKTVDFLDALKARHQLTSDYQLCKLLRWPNQRMSMYRTGRRELDDDACVQVAHSLGADPAYVLTSIAAARAKREEVKQHWAEAARRLKKKYGALILAAVAIAPQIAPSSAAPTSAANVTRYTLCAFRRRASVAAETERRRRRRRRKVRTVTAVTAGTVAPRT